MLLTKSIAERFQFSKFSGDTSSSHPFAWLEKLAPSSHKPKMPSLPEGGSPPFLPSSAYLISSAPLQPVLLHPPYTLNLLRGRLQTICFVSDLPTPGRRLRSICRFVRLGCDSTSLLTSIWNLTSRQVIWFVFKHRFNLAVCSDGGTSN